MTSTGGKALALGLVGLLLPILSYELSTNRAAAAPASKIRSTSIVPAEVFQGRLRRAGTNQVQLERYGGDVVEVNGEGVSLGDLGIAVRATDNLIDSSGADRELAMSANQLFYVYVSNSSANPFPSELRASGVAPTLLNGIKYLGTSGNAANWRFAGWVRTNNSNQFVDSETERYVINYYNRRPLPLRVVETTDSWTYNTQTWRPWNNMTSNSVAFISNGEDQVHLTFACIAANSGGSACFVSAGIGLDSTTAPSTSSTYSGAATWNWVHVSLRASYSGVPNEGFHFLQLLEISQNVGTTYWKGDDGRTYIRPGATGYVMG